MATQASFASLLGYTNSGPYTRGDVEELYEAIESRVKTPSDPEHDVVGSTRDYLDYGGGGTRWFGRTALSVIAHWPEWDHDREL